MSIFTKQNLSFQFHFHVTCVCVFVFCVYFFLGLVFLVYGLVFMLFLFSAVFAHDHFSGLNLTLRKTAEKTN